MGETKAKSVGRPKKKDSTVTNEESEKITMAQGKKEELSKEQLEKSTGVVKETMSVNTGKQPKNISVDAVRQRWSAMFSKYSSLGYDTVASIWGENTAFLSNPFIQNKRIKQINSPAMRVTKEQMQQAMAEPETHEETLRSVSWGLYYSNYIYQTLLMLNRNTPKYLYYATPLYTDDANSKILKADSIKVDKILKKFNPQLTLKTIATQVAIEGKCSYLVRTSYNKKDVDFLVLQKLNSNQVKITGFGSKQQYIASFNMMIFLEAGYSIEQYPKFIQDEWKTMRANGIISENKKGTLRVNPKAALPTGHSIEMSGKGKYMYWVELPQDLCYTFYSDGSHPNAFPDAIGLFTDLNDLGDYRWLQGNLLAKGVNSILTAEVPLIKDPKPGADSTAINPDTVLGYTDFFTEHISANILPFFGPFEKYTLHSLDNQPESMNIIYSRIRDLIATSGNSALLSLSEKPTVASTLAAEKIQASKNDYVTRQFESFLNEVINNSYDLKTTWNIKLHGNIFTCDDEEKITKELVISGAKGLLPKLLSFEGLTIEDYKGSEKYLSTLGIELQVMTNDSGDSSSKSATGVKKVGRPAKEGNDIVNDNTEISKSAGNNVSEIK